MSDISKIKELLIHAAANEFEASLSAFEAVRNFLRRSAVETLLYRVANGEQKIRKIGDYFFIASGDIELTAVVDYLKVCQNFLQEILKKDLPDLLIELTPHSHRSYSIASVPGFGYLHIGLSEWTDIPISEKKLPSSLKEALSHELGHCCLYSGNRFLDEGFATYVEYLCCHEIGKLHAVAHDEEGRFPSLRTVLALDLSATHTLDAIVPDNTKLSYIKAAQLIEYIISDYGAAVLQKLFDHPLISSNKTAAEAIEAILGSSIEDIEIQAYQLATNSFETPIANLDQWLEDIKITYLKLDSDSCHSALSDLEKMLPQDKTGSILECLVKAKTSWYLSDSFIKASSAKEQGDYLSALRGFSQLYRSKYPQNTELNLFFSILDEIVSLRSAYRNQRYMEIDIILKNCREKIQDARKKFPASIDLLLCETQFINETPEQYGGGTKKALRILEEASPDQSSPLYPCVLYWKAAYANTIRAASVEESDEADDFFVGSVEQHSQ